MSQHLYAISFWNEETDHEFMVVFYASDWFSAETMSKDVEIDGYIRGDHFFADDADFGDCEIKKLDEVK